MSGLWQAGAGGWKFVSYTTAAAAASCVVSNLDLNTDLAYQFVFETTEFSADEGVTLRINSDSGGDSSFSNVGATSGDVAAGVANGTGATQISTYITALMRAWSGVVVATLIRDGRTGFNYDICGVKNAGGTGNIQTAQGAGHKNWTTNMTSLQFRSVNSNTADWKIWCLKPAFA